MKKTLEENSVAELKAKLRGRVIEPDDMRPLDMIGPERHIPLTSALAFLGAAMIAISLVHWRRWA